MGTQTPSDLHLPERVERDLRAGIDPARVRLIFPYWWTRHDDFGRLVVEPRWGVEVDGKVVHLAASRPEAEAVERLLTEDVR